ncbi:hypothetical protein P168DRAFT_292152 [Aspergillus campestris IBT 28561]|uniref:Uncharacterized protein n=1 Tax=Aspergillus campestris (strain IBT 28561) TaxID=1392248 RepID=A0A2I1CWP0_ASPC2|nr:uncharacterized protein P168DRAFT_292152 [Aspergillus campestris IBT 28561]PKY02036.1 hypothetical protein P168DRAFT_292152 [Aspergillus campestris IBT 28561]
MKEEQKPRVHTPGVPVPPSARRTQRPPLSGMGVRDIRQTKEYKVAARRWLSTIVALPVFMYTSWVLYERTYGDKQQKRLNEGSGSGNETTERD